MENEKHTQEYNLNSYTVYWIRTPDSTDIKSQGYVGITSNFNKQMSQHKTSTGVILERAIVKHGWDNLVKEIVVENVDKEFALLLEELLRPMERTGWNLCAGGYAPVPPFGKKNALGNKSRIGRVKFLIKCTNDITKETYILKGKNALCDKGFDPSAVYRCMRTGKTHKGFRFEKTMLPYGR